MINWKKRPLIVRNWIIDGKTPVDISWGNWSFYLTWSCFPKCRFFSWNKMDHPLQMDWSKNWRQGNLAWNGEGSLGVTVSISTYIPCLTKHAGNSELFLFSSTFSLKHPVRKDGASPRNISISKLSSYQTQRSWSFLLIETYAKIPKWFRKSPILVGFTHIWSNVPFTTIY